MPKPGLDLPAWLTAIATIVLAGGVWLGARQLRESRIARLTETAADLSRRWDGDELIAARDAIDDYGSEMALCTAVIAAMNGEEGADADYNLLLREPNFFDDLGAMELLGGVTLQWIELTLGDIVTDRWDLWKPTVDAWRDEDRSEERPNPDEVYGNFERLAKKLKGESLNRRERLRRWLAREALKRLN